ncbi:hypothetical protein Pmani_015313 [Petrolisthes manimaculis]|uniref:DUF7869 domain-containing protein n=2 Tax=Petrolisthes manimaculis TaxID=1843537 RepID=A0AAE1UBR0_9EUCA|nr:hypothetical protein Pmani_015313 [Petrolisthes manimaculis]
MSSSNVDRVDSPAPVVTQPETEGDIWSAEPQWKRTGDVSQWAKNVAKKRRDSGLEYISVTKKVAVPAKVVGPALPCSKKCYDRVGMDIVNNIFNEYWKMASHNTQSSYIAKHILSKEVNRRYSGPNSKRNVTYEYFVTVNKKDIVVCKTCFCNIHAISKKRVENVLSKVGSTGVAPVDQRGASASVNKTHDDVLQNVQDHVRSLPTCSSHYSRAKSRHRVYLPPGYSHRKCYDLYKHQCEEKNLGPDKIVSFNIYSKTMRKFNIGRSPPMLDTCSTCDQLKRDMEVAEAAKDTSKTSELVTKKRLYLIKANVARSIMDAYGYDNDPSLCAITMDLQQTLVTPRLTTNVAYYKRKMWTYNFGIHNLKEKSQVHLYVWNETIAKRGSSEIGSCLLHYIEHHVPSICKKLVIFSDNCGGQNKNLNISLLLLRYIHSGRFSMVKHYFLMSGHSFMPCDRDFGNLEKYFYGHEIYTTPHYIEMMREARRNIPFNVIEMDSDSFVDLNPLQAMCTRTQLARARYKDGRMFQYWENFKLGMGIWQGYNEDIGSPLHVKLQKGKSDAYQPDKFNLAAVNLPVKNPQGVKLKSDKLDDLNHLFRFVPLEYRTWFTDIFAVQGLLAVQDAGDMDPDEREDDILDY